MKKSKCPACGKTAFQPATYAARRDLDGRRFTADVPSRKCTSCAELLISGPGLRAFERAITLELVRGGEVGPEGFRWLRKAAGLKAVRLAELLDVTPMQVSRWENGRKRHSNGEQSPWYRRSRSSNLRGRRRLWVCLRPLQPARSVRRACDSM